MMHPLEKSLRGQLEKTVKDARNLSELAAQAALEHLGVGEAEAFGHLSDDERDLRRRLRVHGRQLGDNRSGRGSQEIDRLIGEVAYEHWHRMLFARFLAENNLLMYPDPDDPVAVSLDECEELAPDEGATNGWELAARYAAKMLPQIFRPESPVFGLSFSPEHQQALEKMVEGLPVEVFSASDALGWVYQFWQAEEKDRVNASEVKIGAKELPAVTQLFTEPYMVSFLLDNSLGAWWARHRLSESDLTTATSEAELRQKASIPGVQLEYLRFVRQTEAGPWQIAAGQFEGWPEQLGELKALDPCCGSGHFLVAALLMLTPMRMELEGLSAREAVDAVLRDNLNGLELDARCVELAAFALALTAWRYPDAGGYRALPELSVACSGLSVSVAKEEWRQLGLGKKNLSLALEAMHEMFKEAPVLGSLLDPARSEAAKMLGVTWEELSGAMATALQQENGEKEREATIVAQGLAKAAILLSQHFHWVMTNVPYLGIGDQSGQLASYCQSYCPQGKYDLAIVFLERCLDYIGLHGLATVVLPQGWLYKSNYAKYRERVISNCRILNMARLGAGAFETINGEEVNVMLLSIDNKKNDGHEISVTDVSSSDSLEKKMSLLMRSPIKHVSQKKQRGNHKHVIITEKIEKTTSSLSKISSFSNGLCLGDQRQYRTGFWEIDSTNAKANGWAFLQSTTDQSRHYSGMQYTFLWEQGAGRYMEYVEERLGEERITSWVRGGGVWGTRGILVSAMGELKVSIYQGDFFDDNAVVITTKTPLDLKSVWSYVENGSYNQDVRKIDQSQKVRGPLIQVPYDTDHWSKIADERYPHGLPDPYSDDPTQWIFHGHPSGSVIWNTSTKLTDHGPLRTDETVLHIAVARLLGYQWPAELAPDMELAPQQREWANRCSVLHSHADQDGIVCIPSVRGEQKAEDRLKNLLADAYGDTWSTNTLDQLLASCDHAGKSLDSWLRDKFFAQHFKLFGHRPFVWHIWDGLSDGFSALVNYHKLNHKNLETLTYTYLGDWITRQQENDRRAGLSGDGEKTAAGRILKQRLELILEGEAPYDIFVRWKPLDQQPVGWNPDLNDGVRLNIRPFMSVPDVKKKGAGILRDKPNIKWAKDKGGDVESAPWFHKFRGDRINDHHLTLAEKK